MQTLPVSVTILVKNAQSTFNECLEALQNFDEIIVLDNGSTDETLSIAKNFPNVRIYQSEFIGFGALKNLAVSYAKNEWILSLDSDEILESKTLHLIESILPSLQKHHIYALPRKNLYANEWIKACGWHPDYVWRIFNKNFTRFNDLRVHESLIIPPNAQTFKLESGVKHYAFENISHLLEKLQRYSSLWAQEHSSKSSSPLKATLRGFWSFIKNYFFKKGFAYGYKGFVISVCNALGAFFKYIKLYELKQKKPSCSLIITTYNQKERLALVLDSILALEILPTEVLIADDGSAEDTKDLIESYAQGFPCPLVHIWQEDQGFRASRARNLAIKAARGEYIIIIDGDMIIESHFVSDHLRFAQKGVLIQGSRVILDQSFTDQMMQTYANEKSQSIFRRAFAKKDFKATRCVFLSKLVFTLSRTRANIFQQTELVKGVRSCNMSFYKSDCVAINGFNEAFEGWGREDSEFVARFLFNGGELRRLKFAGVAYHLYHKENTRAMLESNHALYLQTLDSQATFCEKGLANSI